MATWYRIYGNAGSGGPVDYTTVLQDSASTTFSMATIAPGDWTFGVRAYDTVSGLEEMNTDAIVSVVIGADYLDHTAIPNSPVGLSAVPTAGGGARLDFTYIASGQGGKPTSFEAWLWPGTPNWSATPTATLAVTFGQSEAWRNFAIALTGLTGGTTYSVGVRAVNAAGNDGNTTTVTVLGISAAPAAVGSLAVSAGYA